MMQKGQHDQSKVNVAYSYASEQGLQQKAAAPNPPAETQLADPLSFMAKAPSTTYFTDSETARA